MPAIPADTFAHRLMLARAHAGHLSIRDAATMCGFGRGAWTNWEKGSQPVDMLYAVEVISEKLNVDPDWLLNGGQLREEDQPRDRRIRWSTVRPADHYSRRTLQATGEYSSGDGQLVEGPPNGGGWWFPEPSEVDRPVDAGMVPKQRQRQKLNVA